MAVGFLGAQSLSLLLRRRLPRSWSGRSLTQCVTSPGTNLLTWNVAGLRALIRKNPDALHELVEDLQPAAICLQETKLQGKHVEQFQELLPEYNSYWNCSIAKNGYSGTSIYIRKGLPVIDVQYGIGDEATDAEGRVITLSLPNCFLVTSYVPNAGEGLKRLDFRTEVFESQMTNFLRDLAWQKPVIYCGDLNVAHHPIDLHDPVKNRFSAGFTDEERQCFTNLLRDSELIDVFRWLYPDQAHSYTYWSYRTRARDKNLGWRIDYFLISPAVQASVADCGHLQKVFGSDHCPVLLSLKDDHLLT